MEKRNAGNEWERNLEDKHGERQDRKGEGNKKKLDEMYGKRRAERSGKAKEGE